MEGLGEFLKHGREKAGITLDDLARLTRIRIENLESLEREDLDNLPSDAYVRGFVRQVCREVGLAPNDGLVRYDVLRARTAPPDEMIWAEERVEETPGRLERALEDPERVVRIARKGGRVAAGAGIAAVVVIVALFTWRTLDRGDVAATAAAPPRATAPAPKPTPPKPAPAVVDAATPVRPAAPDPGPVATPKPAAPAPDPVATSKPSAPAVDPAPAPSDGLAILELRASRGVDVAVLLDGRGAERNARLEAGDRRRWKAEDHFVVRASDGGAVRVFLDGRDLGPAGEDGVATLRTIRSRTS